MSESGRCRKCLKWGPLATASVYLPNNSQIVCATYIEALKNNGVSHAHIM